MIIEVVLAVICAYIGYRWYQQLKLYEKIKWTTDIPGWPIIGNMLEFREPSETLSTFHRLFQKHGKILKLNILTDCGVIISDYDLIEFLLGTNCILNKSRLYTNLRRWLGTGLLTSNAPKWKNRRRMITPAFHFSILEQFVDYFDSNGKILIDQLQKELDKESFDVYPYITLYALDVISETAMGVKINAQKIENSEYVTNVKEMLRIITGRSNSPLKRNNFTYKLTSDYKKEIRAVKQLHSVTYSIIDARKKELKDKLKTGENDLGIKRKMAFLDILLQSTVDGKPLSRYEVREEVDTFMFGGHDTTAAAMSFAVYSLANNPKVQECALQEQRDIFENDPSRSASYGDLQAMHYLGLVIKETLRLYPSAPMIGREADRDVKYKGNVIPKGIRLIISIYEMLRDPDYFEDPDKFYPERFESRDGSKPFSYIPFSAGPRNCIGQKFAILEMKSCLSKMLRNFELLPATPEHKLKLTAEVVLKSQNGVRIKLKKRKW